MTSVAVMHELVIVAVSPKLLLMPTRPAEPPEAVTLSILTWRSPCYIEVSSRVASLEENGIGKERGESER